jgi:riboflavin kinase/FMN adenylyltransferase
VNIYSNFESLGNIPNPVLTIGTFDGVHVGHQKILNQINKIAQEIDGESVLFTFYPHPRMVINPTNHGLKLIQTQEEKIEKLDKVGLDHLIVQPFTELFSHLTAREFVEDFLVNKLHVHTIVVGYDHQFGKNREGNFDFLVQLSKELNFRVVEIPAHEIDEVNVSSTKIRNAIEKGAISTANTYLNECFSFEGKVISGQAIGRKIGFPTANIEVRDTMKIIPEQGVFAVELLLESGLIFPGMMNIGKRPSVDDSGKTHIEVHLFDFDGNLYEQNVRVFLMEFIRDEIKFASLDDLKQQLMHDEQLVRSYFLKHATS